jgi:small subunit ribosomal protein S20
VAHSLSAKKRVRQARGRTVKNRIYKSKIRTERRSAMEALTAKKPETTQELKKVVALIQRVASKGIIHKNKAANLVSKLTRRLASAS